MTPAQQGLFRLLCALLGSNPAAREHAYSATDPATADALIELADKERVGPALHEALIACAACQETEAQRERLARAWQENLRRNLQIRSTLLSLAEVASSAGFEFVALKGAAWLLDDPANAASWRSILDIDVLVDPRRFDEMPALFGQLGYWRISNSARFHHNFHHAPFWKPHAPCTIEVHRHLGWRHQLLAPELIFSAAKRTAPGIFQPAPWCRAFHAIIHWQVQDCGFSRRSVPLKEVLEVARFMARSDVDWPNLVAHAHSVGALRECEAAMALAAELLSAAIPAELKSGALGKRHLARALAQRSSAMSSWLATELWRAGTLWRCEKVAYRAFLRGATPASVSARLWMGRVIRLPILAARIAAIAARAAALWMHAQRRPAPQALAPPHSGICKPGQLTRNFYEIYGLAIASEIALPELTARELIPPRDPDVEILRRPVPPALIAAAGNRFLHAENGEILLSVPQVARYCITTGSKVLVEPQRNVNSSLVRLFLLGSVIGLLCQQRGLLALHASAVEINGEAVAFVGEQGQGKSTLAAHCHAHGPARLVADDILVVSFDGDDRPEVHPGMPAVKLWRDALQALGREPDGLRADWVRAEKFIVPVVDQVAQAPARLNCIYVLDDDPSAGDGRIETLSGANAAAALVANTYRVEYLDFAGDRLAHFTASTRLAERIPVLRLSRSRDLTRIPSTAAMILADFASRKSPSAPVLASERRRSWPHGTGSNKVA